MNAESTHLLFLKSQDEEDFLSSHLEARGWRVHVGADPGDFSTIVGNEKIRVGLVHWDDDTARCRKTEDFLGIGNAIHWIALVPRESAGDGGFNQTINKYCYAYHSLPLDADRLSVMIDRAQSMAEMQEREILAADDDFLQHGLVGRSHAMRQLFRQIQRVGESELTVLIRGESGTGKELAAQAIHRLSGRANGPFVAVNCGALPKDLIQAELFGHEKGAFTGADRRRVGRIEAAEGGTIFLDEIGDLPLDLQVNLLRFLQEKTIDRVGNCQHTKVDVRVIAATNVNLEEAVAKRAFREDLFYRLNVLQLEMPALRERVEDIELLATYFFQKFSSLVRPGPKGFTQRALASLKEYPWPGNVRELVNRIQRAVVMSEQKLIRPADLGLDLNAPNPSLLTLKEARAHAEKNAIEHALASMRNNVSKAAKNLGVSRVTLYRLMELHSIEWQRKTIN